MQNPIQIVIADDYSMFREGIKLMLEKENVVIAGEAENGMELLRMVRDLKPEIVVTDIEMPEMNGIEATKEIKKDNPGTGIIALTMFGDDHLIVDMLEAGASGYLLKTTKKDELIEAIHIVKEGGTYFCNSTSMKLSKMIAKSKMIEPKREIKFSDKEIEIIRLICGQYASKEIADMTNLTHRTVEKYRDNIMQKTGARNMAGIVIFAIRNGIYEVNREGG
jgi:DNA-binding NarL/FixJ family response regulator